MRIVAATGASLIALFRARQDADEVEARYTGVLDRATVVVLLRYLRSVTAASRSGSGKVGNAAGVQVGRVASTVVGSALDSLDVSVEEKDDSLQMGARGGRQLRVTVVGDEDTLRAVMDAGRWPPAAVTVMRKERVRAPVEIAEYRMRVNMKREEAITDAAAVGAAIAAVDRATGSRKTFRLKRRFEFPTADGAFRIDVTGVRQATGTTFAYAALAAVPERYEAEVEYVGGDAVDAKDAARMLVQHANVMLKVIDATDVVMSLSEKRAVLQEYLQLVAPTAAERWGSLLPDAPVASAPQNAATPAVGGGPKARGHAHRPMGQATAHEFFVGPKPVTLELQHIIPEAVPPDEPSLCSLEESPYTVTEKADGDRRLLFVSAKGPAFTIDDRLAVRATGLECAAGTPSLLDGEHVMAEGEGTKALHATFMCFDAYFVDGVDVSGRPLMMHAASSKGAVATSRSPVPDRLSCARNVAVRLRPRTPAPLVVRVKDFRYIGDAEGALASGVRWMLTKRDAGNFPYQVDGMIFTPALAAVGASRHGAASLTPGRWTSTFKWKPPEMNTIDFLVRLNGSTGGNGVGSSSSGVVTRASGAAVKDLYRVAELLVGYNPDSLDPITTWNVLTRTGNGNPAAGRARREYVARLFAVPDGTTATAAVAGMTHAAGVCYLRMHDRGNDKYVMLCDNGDEILDNTIVEFAYDAGESDQPTPFRWRPMRGRPEKTERYIMSGRNISNTANDMATALGVWRSIHAPVTEAMLTGRAPIPTELPPRDDDAYYTRGQRRQDGSATAGLRAFHNAWVKGRSLLLRFGDGNTRSLFDVGCGRGGDLFRWVEMRVASVLGIDVSSSGITNPDPNRGANARLVRLLTPQRHAPNMPLVKAPNIRVVFLPLDASKPIDATAIDALNEANSDRLVARVAWSLQTDERLRSYHGFAVGGFDLVTCMFATHYFFESRQTLQAFCGNVATHVRRGGHFVGCCLDGFLVDQMLRDVPEGSSVQGGGGPDKRVPLMWRITRMYEAGLDVADPKKNVGLGIKVYMESIGQALHEYLVDYRLLRSEMAAVGLVPPDAKQCTALGFPAVERDGDGTGTFGALYRAMEKEGSTNPALASALAMSEEEKRYSFLNRWFVFVKA